MNTIELMRQRLAVLKPSSIVIRDDSDRHAGHAGARAGGGHYHLAIVSDDFTGRPTLARHRMVYEALGDMMQRHIHALAIQAMTADEAESQPQAKEHR